MRDYSHQTLPPFLASYFPFSSWPGLLTPGRRELQPETGTQPWLCKVLVQTRVNVSSALKLVVFKDFSFSRVFSFSEPLGAISSSERAGTVVLPRAGGFLYLEDTEEQSAKHVSLGTGCEALPNWGPPLGLEDWLEEAPDLTQTSSCFFCSYFLFVNAARQASGPGRWGQGDFQEFSPLPTVTRQLSPDAALHAQPCLLCIRTC